MRKYNKRFTRILPLFLSLVGCLSVTCFDFALVQLPNDDSFHFNLITVNALFAGFLYTNYSLLIGVLDNKIIEKVSSTSIIPKRNQHILNGIVNASLSVMASLYIILVPDYDFFLLNMLRYFMCNVEIICMIFLIIYFLLSLYEMNQLFKAVYKPKNKMSDKELNHIRSKIMNPPKADLDE